MKSCYKFGPFTLDVAESLLLCDGREIKLEPKTFDMLVFFTSHPGERLSLKQIKQGVWGYELEDTSVYRKISDLRKVLLQHDGSHQHIETFPKRGWRFIVEVSAQIEEPPPLAAPPQDIAPPASHKAFAIPSSLQSAGIAVLALCVISAAIFIAKRPSAPRAEPQVLAYRPLTTDGKAKDGPLASDGQYVYFSEGRGGADNEPNSLAQVPIGGGGVVFPPSPFNRPAIFFGIARNTRDILFGRPDSAVDYALFVWRQKQQLLEPAVHTGAAGRMSPDGRSIAYTAGRAPSFELIIRDLAASPNIRRIPVSGIPGLLSWSPDGNRIRFPAHDPVAETSVFWEVRRDGSDLRRLPLVARPQFQWMSGCWTRDGQWFIFSELSTVSSTLWIRREDGADGSGRPVQLTNGPMNFDFPEVAVRGNTVFARGSLSKNQLDRYDAKLGEFTPFWEGVPAIDVGFSNDGIWAAYRRPTDDTLWICKSGGIERKQLTYPPLHAYQPHFSPDGSRIAFMGQALNQPSQIFVIGASGGQAKAVKPGDSPEQGVPSWSADGRYLVFGELRSRHSDEEMEIRLLDLKAGKETVLPGSKGKWTPRWSPDGRYILALATDFGSVALFDCARRRWTPLATARLIDDPAWSLDSQFVHFSALGEDGKDRALFRVSVADGAVERLARYPVAQFKWSGVAPDGSALVLNSTRIEDIYAIDFR